MKQNINYRSWIASAVLMLPLLCAAQQSNLGLTRHSQSGVVYVNGGIGADQQQAMQAMRDEFNLQVTFAAKGNGAFVTGVHLQIQSIAGVTFVEAEDMGPLFLASLAPGTYQITARYGTATETKTVTIDAKKLRELVFYW